ncbi:MAG: TerB family tellurite resistance protein [Myxococcales bacterium]|nr:TerB family tellurite resistance protein [Myxococcales bacterium]
MTVESATGLMRALGFVAWADERLAPEEREMLTTVMDALHIPTERRAELCAALRASSSSVEGLAESIADEVERRFVVAQAIILAGVDGVVVDAERERIAKLATELGIDDDELEFIHQAVDATSELADGPATG